MGQAQCNFSINIYDETIQRHNSAGRSHGHEKLDLCPNEYALAAQQAIFDRFGSVAYKLI